MLDTLASRDAGQGLTGQVSHWQAGQSDPKASFSPKKQTSCSSVRVCPGDLGALSIGESSRVHSRGPCWPLGWWREPWW